MKTQAIAEAFTKATTAYTDTLAKELDIKTDMQTAAMEAQATFKTETERFVEACKSPSAYLAYVNENMATAQEKLNEITAQFKV